jgi:hypothetical protein
MLDDKLLFCLGVRAAYRRADNDRLSKNHGAPDHFPFPIAAWTLQVEQMA